MSTCPEHDLELVPDRTGYATAKLVTYACPADGCAWTQLLARQPRPTREVWTQLGHKDIARCGPCNKRTFPNRNTASLQLIRAQVIHTAENRDKVEARAYECPHQPGRYHLTHLESYGDPT